MSKLRVGKSALLLFLLWLRGPVIVILSIIMATSFMGLAVIPIMVLSIGWSKALVHIMMWSFIVSFGSFLLIFWYEKLMRLL